jgi:hypothetical protein
MNGATIVVLVGPGERELRRLNDLLASILHFEAEFAAKSTLVLVNDRNTLLAGADVPARTKFSEMVVLNNPYVGTDGGTMVYDRLTAGIWAVLLAVVDRADSDFVLKADTDALACGRFSVRITDYFQQHPTAGLIGSLTHNPDGARRNTEDWWGRWIRGTCGPVPHQWLRLLWCNRRRNRLGLELSRWRARNALYRRASRTAWVCGANILGGAYAISPAVVRRLRENRSMLEDEFLFNETRMSDDVAVSILIVALGFDLMEYNRPGDVFAVWYQKPTIPLREVVAQGYGLVHSIKAESAEEELQMRMELAALAGMSGEFRAEWKAFL